MYLVRLFPLPSLLLLLALRLSGSQDTPQAATRVDVVPSQETISTWETRLQADPENVELRGRLLSFYATHGPLEKRLIQALWMVQHHPESPYAALTSSDRVGNGVVTEADDALIKSAWEQAMVDQADSGKVLYNAGLFFVKRDPIRAVRLLEQARQLESENVAILRAESRLFVETFLKPSSPFKAEDAQTLQSELASATDPALLAEVGSNLLRLAQSQSDGRLKAKGTELINRAISLDPTNERWKSAAERATIAPPPPPPPPGGNNGPTGPVRIGAQVAESNLIRKVTPVYPSAAVPAHISGTVEFTATVGVDGRIQNLQLMRGHPLFVNAAKEAVLQYVYKPVLLNGNPVPVTTQILVPFEAPAQ